MYSLPHGLIIMNFVEKTFYYLLNVVDNEKIFYESANRSYVFQLSEKYATMMLWINEFGDATLEIGDKFEQYRIYEFSRFYSINLALHLIERVENTNPKIYNL